MKRVKPMKRYLLIFATTCIVGFGVWFGVFIIVTVHGLMGEANPGLYEILSVISCVMGVVAALVWAYRRIRAQAVSIFE
jgi:hypothetical protein